MRRLAALLAALLLIAALSVPVYAEDALTALQGEADPEAGLSEAVIAQIGEYDGALEGFGLRLLRLLTATLGQLQELHLREGLAAVGMILAAALLCALLKDNEKTGAAATLLGALTVLAACTGNLRTMIGLGTQTISDLHQYTALLLPAMTPLLAASGKLHAAATSGFAMVMLEALLSLVTKLLVPMLYLLLLLCAAEEGLGMKNLSKLRELLHWMLVTAIKGVMYGYTAVLSVTGLIAGTLDTQKLRTLRSVIAGMVPVVGNLVSEASGSLLSAASLLKTGVGLYGMLAVFGIALGPFLQVGLHYLLLKLAAALCGLFGAGSVAALVEKLGQVLGLLLALTGIACLMSLMILVLCIRTVSP